MTVETDAHPRDAENGAQPMTELRGVPAIWKATSEELALLKRTFATDKITDDEFAMFLAVCKRNNLDPFKRQAYVVKYGGKAVVQTGIDGYRALAARTGELDGQDPPIWYDLVTSSSKAVATEGSPQPPAGPVTFTPYEVWPFKDHPPFAARAAVYRKGVSRPFVYLARFDAFVRRGQDGTPMNLWRTMPDVMIFKCALAQSLRAAFPDELAGIYTVEEMEQAANEARAPESGIPVDDIRRITEGLKKAQQIDVARAIEWLRSKGFTGETRPKTSPRGKVLTDNVRVLDDFANNGKHEDTESVLLILSGTDPVSEGEYKAFDPEEVGGAAT